MARILHAGCGGDSLPPQFSSYDEVRLDINPDAKPDVVASITDLGDIGEFEGLYCSHCVEHLNWQDVGRALREFWRVLKPNGFAVVVVPDLEGIKPTDDVLYEAACGPITGLDMIFGHREMSRANPHMRHQSGFVRQTLEREMQRAGFERVSVHLAPYTLIATGVHA